MALNSYPSAVHSYVFDSSFIAALIIPDEKNSKVEEIYASVGINEEIAVPQLFWYEVASILKSLVQRKRYSYDETLQFLIPLTAMRLTNDNKSGIDYTKKLLDLCNNYNLSSYDAAYLELTERRKAILCTLDKKLQVTARKHGLAIIK
jgi:predicted nucleic acid-binding protein